MSKFLRAQVKGLNHRGEGVAKVLSGPDSGLVAFIPATIPGDLVEFLPIERKKNFLRGRVKKFLEFGPGRVREVCPVASRCGGCSWQHIDYVLQLEWKKRFLQDALGRIAKIYDCEIRACIPSPKILGYRNKVEVPVAKKGERIIAGFYEPYSHRIVESESCVLEHPRCREVIIRLLEQVRKRKYQVYDEKTGRGQIRHLVSRVAPGTGERMAIIVANSHRLAQGKALAKEMLQSMEGLRSVVLNINTERTNVILGQRNKLLGGRWYIEDLLGDPNIGVLRFRISPSSFYQVNSYQTVTLYSIALSAAKISADDVVYDVYSGIGTVTLFAARQAALAVGIEEVRAAVIDARKNARENGIDNVKFTEGKAEHVLPQVTSRFGRPSVVILDPPRAGAAKAVLTSLVKVKPRAIIYISCNPSTLARDLSLLKEHGWYPKWCQPVDMFPMTPHVESVTLLVPN